jgi:hypothetical protein
MSAHTRFALPMNTHSNLKFLHDQAQAQHEDNNAADAAPAKKTPSLTKPHRDAPPSSELEQKIKTQAPGKATAAETEVNERKRSIMRQLIGSHAFVQMGRR